LCLQQGEIPSPCQGNNLESPRESTNNLQRLPPY
jgi:hypothetical protein